MAELHWVVIVMKDVFHGVNIERLHIDLSWQIAKVHRETKIEEDNGNIIMWGI